MKKRLVVLFLAILSVLSISPAYSQERISFELPLQSYIQKVGSDESSSLSKVYNGGISSFVAGDYTQAVDNFSYVLNSKESSEELVGAALWGRAWANACLGNNEELVEDLNEIAVIAGLYESCECEASRSFEFAKNFSGPESFQLVNDYDGRYSVTLVGDTQYCLDTVDNCSSFLKAMCVVVKDKGARVTLALFIDALADKAKNCCRAGGFWRNCVQKMVDTMNDWKMLGIPPDPYWD